MPGELLPVVETVHFCRNPEQFGDGSQSFKMRTNRPKWWLVNELPWMRRTALEEVIQAACNGWDPTANVHASRANSQSEADWLFTPAQIDGPGQVLADAQLPNPSLRQQLCRIDVGEQSLAELLVTILMHEIGHLWGLLHMSPSPPAELMDPSLNPAIRSPQPTEAALMAQLYGLPIPSSPIPGVPGVPPVIASCRVEVVDGLAKASISVEQAKLKAHLTGEKRLT